ncbi:hypothetical protein A2U01_0090955, partial [Trifolium medium]|nr:hypothetical protein [Trifolium medium]
RVSVDSDLGLLHNWVMLDIGGDGSPQLCGS